ncbi:MAG: type II secretion system F family protein [Candidatus Phosphoribacter baldrii]|jgi:tight adherence protein C|nr:type II secretion system F family protein [Candidatus Phosphoribacter baldrii]MBK6955518.1 type II secretion system F family protein [Candidatus Phosphoribacter baldrii]
MNGVGSWSAMGGVVGAGFGLGWVLVFLGLPAQRRPGLDARLAPYLRDAVAPSRLLASMPRSRSRAAEVAAPLIGDLARWVDRIMGGSASVRRRLQRAGLAPDVEGFRGEQVVWGALGGAVGTALAIFALVVRGAAVLPVVMLVVASVLLGVIARDQWLTRQASAREQLMLAEFPTVAELLALAVSAGEGATGALDRVCRLSHGELSVELGRCLADARAGANLPTALQGLADRTGLVSLTRFVDGMVVAVERGTPLAEVLRAQAQDVREAGRRAVMEAGGRKEIAMMIPVVFLVLPVTVLFAVFPGFAFLRLSM